MSLKDNITLSMSQIDNFDGHYLVINSLVQYYTFAYVWLSCIDTYLFGF
jgi:hypothetical protein